MLKKSLPILAFVGAIAIISLALIGFSQLNNPVSKSLGLAEFNNLNNPVITSTTTGSFANTVPVKVLANKTGRKYARIINDDATNDVYLYITNNELCYNFTAMASTCYASATSTITGLTGIRLENGGGYYDILPDNQFNGEVWATSSSAVGLKIITIER